MSCQEVFNLIQKIPSNKASGLDNISARLLKEASPIVTRSLTFIINQSITTGIFPNAWKRARVSSIFKEGRRTDPNNYRPISVLPVVSKLIERVVFNQLYEYLKRFSFECHKTKTKTKVITLANHKEHRQYSEPIKTRSNYM